MLCSDEEIPCVEPVIKYRFKFSRDCGEERLIVQKIRMNPRHVGSPRTIEKGIPSENSEINNSAQKHKDTMNSPAGLRERGSLSADRRLSMRKSVEKLNDESITEMLDDSGSSVDSECDEATEHVPQKADVITSPKSSEARERWIAALCSEDLGSPSKHSKHNTSKTSRRSLVYQNDVDQDSKKNKETPKKIISKIVDYKNVLNESVERARRSQRKCKTKYDAVEWDGGSLSQKNNRRVKRNAMGSNRQQSSDEDSSASDEDQPLKRRIPSSRWESKNVGSPRLKNNRRLSKNAVELNGQQSSSDEDSPENWPLKRRMPSSRLEIKNAGSPNLKIISRENKNASESIDQQSSSDGISPHCRPLKRTASQCKSKKAARPCQKNNRRLTTNAGEDNGQQSSSDEDSSDYQERKTVSQCKINSKSNGIECEAKEAFKTSEKRMLRKTSAKDNELSKGSLSSDYEIIITKPSVSCNEKKHDGNSSEYKPKESHRKRVTVEENEKSSSDDESPLINRVKNKKVALIENSLKGSPAKSTNITPVKDNHSSQRNAAVSMSPDIMHNKKNQNKYTPKHKSVASGVDRTTEENLTPTTPSSRRTGFKRLLCTPSMPICKRDLETPRTPLQQAMTKLHVSAVPQSLPCREAEFANVHRFLEGKILDGAGGCIYVSGVPGTGKTATVREVVRSLKQDVRKGDLPDFQFIEINGMRLSHPRQAYVQLWKALVSETVTAEQAQRLLESKFTKSSKKQMSVVLLVDEVDVLWTKRQDVVYNLLDWPTKAKSHLVVITIANTMDLPERLLMGRVTSRLGLTRLTFQPYSHKQLEEIVKARLQGINAFDPDAIQFVSRKVASVSGDARRALDICRRATEIAEQDSPDTLVTIKHVDEAMLTMTSSQSVQAIVHACSAMEKLFLQAVDAELTRTGLEETTFCKAFKTMETLCSLEGLQLPPASLIMKACMNLSSMRLLLSQHSNMDIYTRIFLNVSSDDLHYALKCVRKEL